MVYAEITWIFVCAIFLALVVGFGLGANDVANAFAPSASVGAKALTLRQALVVASIFEFTGAVLMGSGVVSTIRSGITNVSYFVNQPDVLAYGTCLISIFIGIPVMRRKVERDMEAENAAPPAAMEGGKSSKAVSSGDSDSASDSDDTTPRDAAAPPPHATSKALDTFRRSRVWKALTHGMDQDIHADIDKIPRVAEIHAAAEVFDKQVETSFKYLRVCTACANSFAHGSNEVANSVGALAAIYQIWQDTSVSSTAPVPTWLLAIGGVGIIAGVALWGYKIMRVLGVQMAKLTNSHGFTIELCAAAVVILASRFDLPLSTTHAAVGAVAGIGLLEGRRGFNSRLFVKCVAGWVFTIIIVAAMSAAFAAQGLYSPNRDMAAERAEVGAYLNGTATDIATLLNAVALQLGNTSLGAQAQELLLTTAAQQAPLVTLLPPMQTQLDALVTLNQSALCMA
ncbi:sodium phosphate symporter [Micractinium conductrix]|uniref:Phosphate transporter n=1 Tax=Micractinium conductrix TaxID=554055 RepID=A0A2P6VE44_9CHLO|nr:sodium phosphate symporter [Micractinium conductrix]|eukprot:PSC72363.1 sodium phosphate symporter [Micractinium conductrix]